MAGILMLAAYALVMLGITLFATKKPRTALEFHVADRNMGTLRSALSLAATWIWVPARYGLGAKRIYLFQLSALSVLSTAVNLLADRGYLILCTQK